MNTRRRLDFENSDVNIVEEVITPPTPPVSEISDPGTIARPPAREVEANYFRFAAAHGDFNLETAAAEWDRQRATIDRLVAEKKILEDELFDALSDASTARTVANLDRSVLITERQNFSVQKTQLEAQLGASLQEISRLEDKNAEILVEFTTETQRLLELERDHRNLTRALSEISGKLSDLEFANNVLQRDCAGRSDEISRLTTENGILESRLQKAHVTLALLRSDKLALHAEIAQLRRRCEDLPVYDVEDEEWVPAPPRRRKQTARMSCGRRDREQSPTLEGGEPERRILSDAIRPLPSEQIEVVIEEESPLKKNKTD